MNESRIGHESPAINGSTGPGGIRNVGSKSAQREAWRIHDGNIAPSDPGSQSPHHGRQTHKRLKSMTQTPNGPRKWPETHIPRAGKKALVANVWWATAPKKAHRHSRIRYWLPYHAEGQRESTGYCNDTCEVCGSKEHSHAPCTTSGRPDKKGRREKPAVDEKS